MGFFVCFLMPKPRKYICHFAFLPERLWDKWNKYNFGSKDKYIDSFARYCQLPLHKGLTVFAFPPAVYAVPLSSCQQRMLLNFWSCTNLIGEKWYLSILLMCIYLIMSKADHLFMWLKTL